MKSSETEDDFLKQSTTSSTLQSVIHHLDMYDLDEYVLGSGPSELNFFNDKYDFELDQPETKSGSEDWIPYLKFDHTLLTTVYLFQMLKYVEHFRQTDKSNNYIISFLRDSSVDTQMAYFFGSDNPFSPLGATDKPTKVLTKHRCPSISKVGACGNASPVRPHKRNRTASSPRIKRISPSNLRNSVCVCTDQIVALNKTHVQQNLSFFFDTA